jgi:putative spermidine/putrescine transport system substrate-binding protein
MNRIVAGVVAAMAVGGTAAEAAPAKLLSYSGIFQDNYTQTVVQPFNAAHAAAPVEFVPSDGGSAGMLGNLRTQKSDPQLDLVIMDTTTAALACAEGLVEPVTPDLVPVLADVDPLARQTGGACGPGVTFDHLVMVYDTQAVTPAPTSWKAMWDPKWKGRVAMPAPPNIQGLAFTAIQAQAETGDWKKADPAFAQLKLLAPQIQTFDPQPDGYTLVLNNVVSIATGWNARAQFLHDQSKGRLGVLLPKEGTAFQINTINVVKGAKNKDAAFAFMNYALGPDAQKAFTEKMFYGPTNLKAPVSQEAAQRTAASPENKARVIPLDWDQMIKLRDNWNQRWKREVISASGR